MAVQNASVIDLVKTLSQFQGSPRYMLLLGAGASATSGVPTASELVCELLRLEYRTSRKIRSNARKFEPDAKIRAWAEQTLPWFKPGARGRSEYELVMANVLRVADARNEFLRNKLSFAKPAKGYCKLGSLISKGVFTTIWTTNFDHLVRASTRHLLDPIEEVNSPDQFSILDALSTRKRIIRLHGDFWHGDIVNTSEELLHTPQVRWDALRRLLLSQGLIVIGYGGRDHTVMNALIRAAQDDSNIFHQGLFWCIRKNETLPPLLKRLFQVCVNRAYLVQIDGFDELMTRFDSSLGRDVSGRNRSSRLESAADETGLAWEGQALLTELADVLMSGADSIHVRDCQRKVLSHLCEIIGATRASLVCKGARQRKFQPTVVVDTLASNSQHHRDWDFDDHSPLMSAVAACGDSYLRFGARKVMQDPFFNFLSQGLSVHTILVKIGSDVRGFVSFAMNTPIERAPIEFRILRAAAKLLVALSVITNRK